MLEKINVRAIVGDHVGTLREHGVDTLSVGDLVLFYGIPMVLAATLVMPLAIELPDAAISILVTTMAILAGLLLNLLLLMHGLLRGRTTSADKEERQLLREVYANISYTVLVCLLAVAALGTLSFVARERPTHRILEGVGFFLLLHLGLTLMMVLKRVHVLLSREFS